MKDMTQSQDSCLAEPSKKIREILVWSFIAIGVLLIAGSCLPMSTSLSAILRGMGLSLAPAGIVTLVITRYASSITEILLRQAVESTIRERLSEDMRILDASVQQGMAEIGDTVKNGIAAISKNLQSLSPLFSGAAKLGLESVHLTRGNALTAFSWFLDAEAQKGDRHDPTARVWIVSSSIKGLLEATSEFFDGKKIMERIARCGCDVRIMMTDPRIADFRANQERRADGEIPKEVEMNLAYLKRIGIKRESVRFYHGTPTVFAIATTDRMLLNPYPYQTEAFRCFSVTVQKTLNPDSDIFHQYLRYHFEEPWQRTTEITIPEWEKL